MLSWLLCQIFIILFLSLSIPSNYQCSLCTDVHMSVPGSKLWVHCFQLADGWKPKQICCNNIYVESKLVLDGILKLSLLI